MIQIDDAGSGSLIGGTCIGVLRKETMEYYYDFIPLELYREKIFSEKKYLDYVVKIVDEIFYKLKVNKEEEILVCRGYMFDNLRIWLSNEKYNFRNCKIEEPLQSLVEKTFENYCLELGLFRNYLRYNKYPFHFHRILMWVYADYDNRKKLCKTGWKSWKKYGNLETKVHEVLIQQDNIMCLKCGRPIPKKTTAKALSYVSNKKTTIFIHKNC